MFWDPTFVLLLPAIVLAVYAQYKVQSTFRHYSQIRSGTGYTGAQVAAELLRRQGITGVSRAAVAAATESGLAIKLIASAVRAGEAVVASALPTAVSLDTPLGRTDGVMNRIEVDGEPVGRVAFEGPGAGGPATSSAVLGDLIAIARGVGSTWAGHPSVPRLLRASRPVSSETFEGPSGLRYPVLR